MGREEAGKSCLFPLPIVRSALNIFIIEIRMVIYSRIGDEEDKKFEL